MHSCLSGRRHGSISTPLVGRSGEEIEAHLTGAALVDAATAVASAAGNAAGAGDEHTQGDARKIRRLDSGWYLEVCDLIDVRFGAPTIPLLCCLVMAEPRNGKL
eukprot:CAMPEP_0172798484 /NCGR_PEP_ID=MMETSP1075-20121228/1207_1 /TAXON_ID=2916 /ORGANISM="Ceratium fusus, Strain PA161109" /LENGTH=103 /DNA_ID=CAMNT_0013635977 /DNA_START=752 /DNA_END=1063 /DNA_ORIENTATION=+